jgi:hypothetical protein
LRPKATEWRGVNIDAIANGKESTMVRSFLRLAPLLGLLTFANSAFAMDHCRTLCFADRAACLYSGKSSIACNGKLRFCMEQCRTATPNRDALLNRPRAK